MRDVDIQLYDKDTRTKIIVCLMDYYMVQINRLTTIIRGMEMEVGLGFLLGEWEEKFLGHGSIIYKFTGWKTNFG